MKKIAFALKRYLNLTETFIYSQLKNISAYETLVLAEEVRNKEKFPHPEVFSISDLPPLNRFLEKLADPFGYFGYYKKVMRDQDVSLIHAHFGWEGIFLLPLARRLKVPLVTSFYGLDVYKMTKNPVYALQQRKLFREGALFITCSKQMREDLIRMGAPADKTRTYYLGVDLGKLHFWERAVKAGEPLKVLMCGRFIEKKGFIYGLKAFEEAKKRRPNMRLALIGSGPAEDELRAYIREHSLENSVSLMGNKNYNEYIEELYSSHVLMSPSITAESGDQEGLPMVLIEALASGMPVIATRYAGIPELVGDGINGFTAGEKSVDELSNALEKLAVDPGLVKRLGKSGRAVVEERFDAVKQAKKIENEYKELLR